VNELALFAGAGGGILGGYLLGWRTVCAVERDAYAAQVLAQRQNDGILAPFPIWSDVTTFDGKPWREIIDVVSGGFPCQDISIAGGGRGLEGSRSGLWAQYKRILREVRPRKAYLENSPMLTSRGLGQILADLAELGFDAEWGVLGAHHTEARHERERIWVLANSNGAGCTIPVGLTTAKEGPNVWHSTFLDYRLDHRAGKTNRWPIDPGMGRVAYGVANGMDRLKALGNGQVPRVAATAWRILI
jgi:DNA (cytosine-5)-methyltransferase 1